MTTQFDGIYHGLGTDVGELRLATIGLGWKSVTTGSQVTIAAGDIKYVQWLRVARDFQLRIILKDNRRRETFDGFQREDHDKISHVIKQHYNVILETKDVSLKGWNWGALDVQGSDLAFLVSNKTAFEVPLSQISNSNIVGKTEVSLEFTPLEKKNAASTPSASKRKDADDELVEMRLHIPGTHTKDQEDEDGERMDVDDDDETPAAQAFHDMIKEKADIGQVTGEGIASFAEVTVLTPRGRYDIDMFPTFLRLRGKTYDYKILYTSITRLFLLPKPDDVHIIFVVGLDPPIRQGQTRYPYLVMSFSRDEEVEVDLQLDEATIESQYNGNLKKHYEAPIHEVISAVFRGLSGKKITAPSGSFTSRDSHTSIKANLKAAQGDLYFLEKALLFLVKPTTLVEYADIASVVFSRVGGGMASARTFDLKILLKMSPEIVFTSINKEEHELVEEFLKSKKLRVKNEMNDDMAAAAALDSDSDEDMQSVVSDGEDAPKPRPAAGNDEDSEEDDDFQASSSDAGSPSESESDDGEGAVTASDDSGDRDLIKKTKPKKTKEKKDKADKAKGKKEKKGEKKAVEDGNPRPKKKAKKQDE